MLSDQERARQRERNGMNEEDGAHERMVAAIRAEVERHGVTGGYADAAVGGIMAARRVKVGSDGSVEWDGPEGWDLQSGVPGWIARNGGAWFKQGTAGQPSAQGGVPTKKQIGQALIQQMAPAAPGKPVSRRDIGNALIRAFEDGV